MFGRIGSPEILLLVLIVLLLFGATRLPRLARSLREAKDEFQKGTDEPDTKPVQPSPVPEAHTETPDAPKTESEKT